MGLLPSKVAIRLNHVPEKKRPISPKLPRFFATKKSLQKCPATKLSNEKNRPPFVGLRGFLGDETIINHDIFGSRHCNNQYFRKVRPFFFSWLNLAQFHCKVHKNGWQI